MKPLIASPSIAYQLCELLKEYSANGYYYDIPMDFLQFSNFLEEIGSENYVTFVSQIDGRGIEGRPVRAMADYQNLSPSEIIGVYERQKTRGGYAHHLAIDFEEWKLNISLHPTKSEFVVKIEEPTA